MILLTYNAFRALYEKATNWAFKKPTYACIKPDTISVQNLVSLMDHLKIPKDLQTKEDDLHATIIYSKADIHEPKYEMKKSLPIFAHGNALAIFGEENDCLVLKMVCTKAVELHREIRHKYGASHGWDSYEPHITLCDKLPSGFVLPKTKVSIALRFNAYEISPIKEKEETVDAS